MSDKKPKLVRNLLGDLVPEEEVKPAVPDEQGELFRVDLTPEEKRARKLAEQHRQDGGKELFDE